MKVTGYILLLVLVLPVLAQGQNESPQKNKTYQNQQWIQYYSAFKLNNDLLIKADGGYRVKNNFSEASQFITRAGLYYKIMPRMQLGGGFAYLGFYGNEGISRTEYRPYQELLINDKYAKFKAQHRIRVEQRFFEYTNGETYFYHRFRYRFLLKVPVFNFGEQRLDLNLADEIFIHGGKDAVYNVFNQNRVMIGTTYTMSNNLAITLTYNSQFQGKNSPGLYDYSNIVWLGIKQTFNSGNRGKDSK